MSNRKDSGAVFNTYAFNGSKPVIANQSVVNISENACHVKDEVKEEQKHDIPKESKKGQSEDQLPFLHQMKNGYLYIIHNNCFYKREDPVRHGSEKDLKSLEDLFSRQFGFKKKVEENLSASEILGKARDISERDFSKEDALFFIILSHGKQEGILGVDEEPVKLATLTDLFTAKNCPSLIGKPKVFIVQACRGNKDDKGVIVSDATPVPAANAALQAVPVESDFLVCYASPIGYSSYRDEENGSWYIQELVRIFLDNYDKEHLMDLMLRVNFAVSKKSCDDGFKQIPSEECRLTKKCYFGSLPQ